MVKRIRAAPTAVDTHAWKRAKPVVRSRISLPDSVCASFAWSRADFISNLLDRRPINRKSRPRESMTRYGISVIA